MTRLLGLTPKNGNRSGDTMPMYHDGKWHIFISDPPNGKWLFPQSAATSTFHIVSEDLVHWEQVECNDLYPGKKEVMITMVYGLGAFLRRMVFFIIFIQGD